MKIALPFAHLNLFRNPFGECTEEERTVLANVDISDYLDRLKDPRYAIQFTGEKGYGKTTHLLALRARLPSAGYVHIGEGERVTLPNGSPIMVDEAQRLRLAQRIKLFRMPVPIVLGTHRDFTASLRRAGRKVETVDTASRMSVERLHEVFNQRIEFVRREEGPVPRISETTTQLMREQFGSDIRTMLDDLFHRFQTLDEIRDV